MAPLRIFGEKGFPVMKIFEQCRVEDSIQSNNPFSLINQADKKRKLVKEVWIILETSILTVKPTSLGKTWYCP